MSDNQITISQGDIPPQTDATTSRQNKPQPMVSFVQLDDSRTAFAYGYLYKIDFDGSSQITMTFMNDAVTITGRGMEKLFSDLRRQLRERVIVEREEHASGEVVVTRIDIAPTE